jgi:hypothetical protein
LQYSGPDRDRRSGTAAKSHFIQLGAFLTPLSPGTHTVTIQGIFDGDALGFVFSFSATYTVIVED